MGKSKNQKHKTNVFKVAGGRSAKAKSKMKLLDAERLKSFSTPNKQKIESIDKQLSALNKEIRQISQPKNETPGKTFQITSSLKRAQEVELYKVTEHNCEQALERLNSFKM